MKSPITKTIFAAAGMLLIGIPAQADTVGKQFPLYVASISENAVLKADSAGNVTQFSQIATPVSIAVAPNGGIFVSSVNAGLFKVDATGNATPFATDLVSTLALAFDNTGNLYVSAFSGAITKIDPSGNESFYGTGAFNFMAFGPDGHLYGTPALGGNNVYRLDDSGNPAPFGPTVYGPSGLAFDTSGNLYVSDTYEAILKLDSNGNPSVFASAGFLQVPFALAFDSNGVLYATDMGTGSIIKIDSLGTQSVFATGLNQPFALAFSRGPSYHFSGFLSPVQNAPAVNYGKAGSTNPIKWTLQNASTGAAVTALAAVKSITYKAASCSNLSGDATGGLPASSSGGTTLRYDNLNQQYVFNWLSPAQPGCYILTLTLDSSQAFSAYFNLK